jgi:putative membrane protein
LVKSNAAQHADVPAGVKTWVEPREQHVKCPGNKGDIQTLANSNPLELSSMVRFFSLCVFLFTTAAFAADVPPATKTFIDKAAVSNKFEIDTSELALKYGKSADVKSFAQKMIDDHKKAGADFKAGLAQANIEPPADSLDVSHTAKYAKLRLFTTEKGFDSAYVDEQLEAHKEAVATFKDYAANGPTPALKSFAEKTLPTLQHHLDMVQTLRSKTPAKD